ncbi:hypothetical protein CV102_25605 [Natronococcus pandeyae]|uniref:Uncharacterized protein n=2 Tax=Natronococcus pandeyae TaxID=2055836 RepID=A0A8J8PZS0_9EURY|nr:hypothetical protein CV102_25605 [Natronococcus pandeyae]
MPEGAVTASPVYILRSEEYERNCELENPYAVSGANNIAAELMDACEERNAVLYPLYAESDAGIENAEEMFEWIADFGTETLGVEASKWYFSGSRSIHAHFPLFAKGTETLSFLREAATAFNEENGASIDAGIYTRKRMFRLPGATHSSTQLKKTAIPFGAERDEIIRATTANGESVPESFEVALRETFLPDTPEGYEPTDFFNTIDAGETLFESPADGRGASSSNPVDGPACSRERHKHPFSPYALAKYGTRSVAVGRIESEPYCSREYRHHANRLVHFYAAVGCTGDFVVEDDLCPVKLSKPDYDKTSGLEIDTTVVIIGGGSGRSRIFKVSSETAHDTAAILLASGRKAALEYLREAGYNVGKAGRIESNYAPSGDSPPSGETKRSAAERLQQRAERESFDVLTHNEKIRVACRLLHGGKEYAHDWIRRNMRVYDPEITERFLTDLLNTYGEDYK